MTIEFKTDGPTVLSFDGDYVYMNTTKVDPVSLNEAIKILYSKEINCGLQTFWDGGVTVWIGDEMNSIRVRKNFPIQTLHLAGQWLLDGGRKLYPEAL